MVEEDTYKPIRNSLRVFYLNDSNEELLKGEKKIIYSEDKNYGILYTKKDMKIFNDLRFEFHNFAYYICRSYKDELYDNLLESNSIINKYDNERFNVSRDEKLFKRDEITVDVEICDIYYSLKISRSESESSDGSEALVGLSPNSPENIYITICEREGISYEQ